MIKKVMKIAPILLGMHCLCDLSFFLLGRLTDIEFYVAVPIIIAWTLVTAVLLERIFDHHH